MKFYKIAIIGGGASGLTSAIALKRAGFDDFVLLERLDRVGKKFISTGNGQGNLSNTQIKQDFYDGNDRSFVLPAIQKYGFNEIKDFYNFLGITLTEEDDGKVYPMSKQASSVLDVMRAYLAYKNTNILTNFFVTDIKKTDDGYILTADNGEKLMANTILLCTGGQAQKQFGTDGNGYDLAKRFGHKITPVYPSLVQLKTDSPLIKGLRGLKADANVYAISNGKVIKSAVGEVLFTDYGVSGNAIFKISGYLVKAKNPEVKISFIPNLSFDELVDKIENRFTTQPYLQVEDALTGLVNKQIGKQIIKTASDNSSYSIAFATKNFILPITGNLGFNYAQVTKGGVSTTDIDQFTMQSKLASNLYVLGELLDVDGDCGGYNLHWAFASAMSAVDDILKNI